MKPLLIGLCGKVGSGKTTAIKGLQEPYQAIVFNADEWMVELFGEELTRAEHEEKLAKCKAIIYRLANNLLERGVSVILDFGFWTRRERDDIRGLFKGFEVKVIYLPVTKETQWERVSRRNQSPDKTYTISWEMLKELNAFFEEPNEAEEEFEVYTEENDDTPC